MREEELLRTVLTVQVLHSMYMRNADIALAAPVMDSAKKENMLH